MKHCQRPLGPLFASALVLFAALIGVPVANAAPVTVTFTTSGIWKAPPGVTSITVETWGGAGGGRTSSGAAGGGGGGAFAAATVAVTPGADLTVTVAGTVAGTTGNGAAGTPSLVTNSSGVILARAAGGTGGTSAGIGGAGGASGTSIGDTIYAGGNGANAAGGNSGGGGGAGTTGAGGGASGTTAGTGTTDGGGNGGAGRTTNGAGIAGSVYGGGGGGARRGTTNVAGGAGAAGQVRITYDLTPGPALEFAAGDGNPTGNGPVIQTTIQFRDNTDNPGGNTFATYNPTPASPLTLTAALSNQQYDYAGIATPAGTVMFGQSIVSTSPIFPLMSSIGAPAGADFTSAGAPLNQGISVANNSAIEAMSIVTPLRIAGRATNQRWQMADLTLTFNRPVDNPILHLAGLGGGVGALAFSTEFNLLSSNVPVTLYKLSGSSALVVATVGGVQQINNGAAAPAASGDTSGKGSILVAGEGIQVITLRIFVRGNGGAADWSVADTLLTGDAWTFGFSLLETDLDVVKTVNNPSPRLGQEVVFTITASNNGVSHSTNVVAQDVLPAGLSFVSANPSAEYDDSTGDWNIGTLERGASRTLEITATVLAVGDITNTATIDGTNGDPIASNNQDDVTLTPTAVVMGHVSLDVTNLTDFLEASGVGGLDAAGLLEFLAVWDPAAAEALSGAGREALLGALRDHLDPDGDGRVVVFRWETLEQRGTVGFYVERYVGDAWMRIHTGLLPALVAAPMGAQYRMVDPGARPGEAYEYRLIELEARGTTREYGPFRPQAGTD